MGVVGRLKGTADRESRRENGRRYSRRFLEFKC
jgi:hypothetical protein